MELQKFLSGLRTGLAILLIILGTAGIILAFNLQETEVTITTIKTNENRTKSINVPSAIEKYLRQHYEKDEFALCLLGNSTHITGYQDIKQIRQPDNVTVLGRCNNQTVAFIHTHPNGACTQSLRDIVFAYYLHEENPNIQYNTIYCGPEKIIFFTIDDYYSQPIDSQIT